MSNETFGLLFIIVLGLLFLVGIGSMIVSCFVDKKYQAQKPVIKKHYYNETEESASVIIEPDKNDFSFDLDLQDIE